MISVVLFDVYHLKLPELGVNRIFNWQLGILEETHNLDDKFKLRQGVSVKMG